MTWIRRATTTRFKPLGYFRSLCVGAVHFAIRVYVWSNLFCVVGFSSTAQLFWYDRSQERNGKGDSFLTEFNCILTHFLTWRITFCVNSNSKMLKTQSCRVYAMFFSKTNTPKCATDFEKGVSPAYHPNWALKLEKISMENCKLRVFSVFQFFAWTETKQYEALHVWLMVLSPRNARIFYECSGYFFVGYFMLGYFKLSQDILSWDILCQDIFSSQDIQC